MSEPVSTTVIVYAVVTLLVICALGVILVNKGKK